MINGMSFGILQAFFTPQMYVGRIPLNLSSEMEYYKSKVQNNINKPYDDWNKKYLFFSGGRANFPDEIALYKSVNDSVINNYIIPPPLTGVYHHFYKTVNPITTLDLIQNLSSEMQFLKVPFLFHTSDIAELRLGIIVLVMLDNLKTI